MLDAHMTVRSLPSATASGFGQLQRQAALRHAEQLEAQARALAAQAREARRTADESDRRAGELEVQAESAHLAANSANRAVATSEGARALGDRIVAQVEQIARSLQETDPATSLYAPDGHSSPPSYAAGSVFSLKI